MATPVKGGFLAAFSIIELLIVMTIFAIVSASLFVIIDPLKKYKLVRDSQRASDLRSLQTALESYYVDKNQYPPSTGNPLWQIDQAPWGNTWEGYMWFVPKDPLVNQQYVYVSDEVSYQIYAKFEVTPPDPAFACQNPCGPNGDYNAYVASTGSSPASFYVDGEPQNPSPASEPGTLSPQTSPSPSPTPIPLAQGNVNYYVSTPQNPRVTQVDFSPLDVAVGAQQTITVKVRNPSEPIQSVKVTIQSDNQTNTIDLSQVSSGFISGQYRDVWTGSWINTDTHDFVYFVPVKTISANGQSTIEISIR